MTDERKDERRDPERAGRREGDAMNVSREEFLKWVNRSVWLARLFVASFLLTAGGFVWAVKSNGDRVDDIQTSRHEACRETNTRHDNAMAALDVLADQAVADEPEREAEIRQGTEQFRIFVQALVPKRDCNELVPPNP